MTPWYIDHDPQARGDHDETERPGTLTGHTHVREGDFDSVYMQGVPPWDIGRSQPAFAELAERGLLAGRVLDAGCGTGEHALMAAALGLEATGFDVAATAIAIANTKARDRGLEARFLELNALVLSSLGEQFDTVLDCGLFHGFGDDDRLRFVKELRASVPVGGHYCMLCFSDRQAGDWGPRRIRQVEIHDSFAEGWTVDSIQPAKIDITIDPHQAEAWLAVITRCGG